MMMQSLRYLNSVLTVIAVLLTLTLWTLWNTPGGETLTVTQPAHAQGTLNQLELQREIRDLIKKSNVQTAETNELLADMAKQLKKGTIKVEVESD